MFYHFCSCGDNDSEMNDFVIIVTGLKSLVLDINVTIHCAGEVAFIIYIRIRL